MDFILRPWIISDANDLVLYANNKKIAENLTNGFPHPYTIDDAYNFINRFAVYNPCRAFAIDIEGKAVGAISVFPQTDIHEKNAELGYWLAEPYWGKGIVSKAVLQIVDYGFRTWDITRIFARPFGRNIASCRVLEKCGFKLEARFSKTVYKNNVFEDELVYAIRKDEHSPIR